SALGSGRVAWTSMKWRGWVRPPSARTASTWTLRGWATAKTNFSAKTCSVCPSTKMAILSMRLFRLQVVRSEQVEVIQPGPLETLEAGSGIRVIPGFDPPSLPAQDTPIFKRHRVHHEPIVGRHDQLVVSLLGLLPEQPDPGARPPHGG